MLLEPFTLLSPKKYQKSITFLIKSWWRFATLQNMEKPLATQRFGACKKVMQNTLWNLLNIDAFEAIFAFWP